MFCLRDIYSDKHLLWMQWAGVQPKSQCRAVVQRTSAATALSTTHCRWRVGC